MRTQEEITAYHEAGHAVMAMSAGFQVIRISTRSDAGSLGHVCYAVPDVWTDQLRRKAILICCGGLAADFLHWNGTEKPAQAIQDEVATGYANDHRNAYEHLSFLSESGHFELYQGLAIKYLKALERWEIVEEIVYFLRQAGAIDGTSLLHRWAEACPPITNEDLAHISLLIERENMGATNLDGSAYGKR